MNVSIKDRTTGKYWGGTAFDQSSQTFLAASLAGNNWSYALDQSKLTSPHAYLVELYSVDNVSNAETHQQIRFTYGSDTGAPTTTLSLTGATNAYLTGAPYVLYYGTALGSGGFTLHASSTDPSGVDTIAFPDLSGTTGFSGSGGTSSNGSNADPFVVDSPAYTFTSGATTAPGLANVTSTRPARQLGQRLGDLRARQRGADRRLAHGERRQRLLDEHDVPGQPPGLHRRRRRLRCRLLHPDCCLGHL